MDLNIFWFILITVLFSGFFFLEGFDYGVGILLPFLGQNENERQQIAGSIGPFWDGNEVWLLTAGGAMFAAFPNWYATMFSGFYLALLLVLVGLILRAVAFEFRNRDERPGWHQFWDWAIFAGSFIPALIWGVAIGNLMQGMAIDQKMNYTGSFFDLLNPYALLGGLTFVALFTLHGAVFLNLKTEGIVLARAQLAAKRVWLPTVGLVVVFVGIGLFATNIFTAHGFISILLTLLTAIALLASGGFALRHQYGWAFGMTALTIVLATVTIFQGLYPRVMISTTDHAYDLTIYNASSSQYTLGVMSWIAIGFVPIVLLYQIWNYWVFRQRVSANGVAHHI